MIYVISDLHGYPHEEFMKLLAQAGFGKGDFLYILGDVIDRNGDGGVETLEWLLYQPNVQLILGNHEAMLLACSFVFDEVTEESLASVNEVKMDILTSYYSDGGEEKVGGDNVPIKPVVEGYPEIKNIIVVYLSDKNHVSRRIQAKDYDKINIIELFPGIDLDGDGFWESLVDGTANFTESRIRLLIQKGYEDTVDYFQRRKIYPVSDYWFQ